MCCGRSNIRVPNIQGSNPPRQAPAGATLPSNYSAPRPRFEYTGQTALTVVSPITGKRYRFSKPGERLEVDPRDQPLLTFVPHLVRVAY